MESYHQQQPQQPQNIAPTDGFAHHPQRFVPQADGYGGDNLARAMPQPIGATNPPQQQQQPPQPPNMNGIVPQQPPQPSSALPVMPPASRYLSSADTAAFPTIGNKQQSPGQSSSSSLHDSTVNHLLTYGGNAPNSGWYNVPQAQQQHHQPQSGYGPKMGSNVSPIDDPAAKRSPRSITAALSQADVEANFITDQLKADYETLASMTLLDDDSELDTLFMRQANFSKPNFLYNFLFNRYDRKYRDLFERYPGAVYWLTFCLATLVTRSEGTLASVCSANTAAGAILRPVRMPLFDTFSVSSNRRSRKERNVAAADDSNANTEDGGAEKSENDESAKRKRNGDTDSTAGTVKRVSSSHRRPQHPFYRVSVSLTNRNLFEIGRMTQHCVPPEFGVLFVHARPGVCVKINTSADRVPLNGIRGTLSRPIIAPLVSRQNRGFTFIHLHFTDALVQMMCRMAEGNAGSNTTMNLGTKLTMRVDNLAQSVVARGEKFSDHKGPISLDSPPFLTAVNQFQCTMVSGNMVEIKAYTDTVFRIGNELGMRSDERQLFEETFLRTKDELLDELERYQDSLDEYEAE